MPIVTIKTSKEINSNIKKSIMQYVTETITEVIGVDSRNIHVFIEEFDEINFNNDAIVLRVEWSEGKTVDQKHTMIIMLTEKIYEISGIEKGNIVILINDLPKCNVGVAGIPRG